MASFSKEDWVLILGGSSGIGLATAKRFAESGASICVVHHDRRSLMKGIEAEFDGIRSGGTRLLALNIDAIGDKGRGKILELLQEELKGERIRVLVHSIALGYLKVLAPALEGSRQQEAVDSVAEKINVSSEDLGRALRESFEEGKIFLHPFAELPGFNNERLLDEEDFSRTVFAMGTSLLTWVRELYQRDLCASDTRVFGLSSEGSSVAWRGYAAISSAKAALEAASRSIALEWAPHGIRSNVIQAGVTDTPAMRAIPGSSRMKASTVIRNPLGRLTQAEDVAAVIFLLAQPEAHWLNGAVIRVDGGEGVSGI